MTAACDLLLQARVDARLQSTKKIEAVANRLTVAMPRAVSGQAAPEPCIPASVLAARAAKAAKEAEKAAKKAQLAERKAAREEDAAAAGGIGSGCHATPCC